jgi:hypothetical protein
MKPEAIPNMLTPKQQLALPLILSGISSLEVSKNIGVKASTISEWLHHSPAFKNEIAARRREMLARTANAVESLVLLSLNELAKIMSSSQSEATRLKACELVISKLLDRGENRGSDQVQFVGPINIPLLLKGIRYA